MESAACLTHGSRPWAAGHDEDPLFERKRLRCAEGVHRILHIVLLQRLVKRKSTISNPKGSCGEPPARGPADGGLHQASSARRRER